jgi:hypothetical protein
MKIVKAKFKEVANDSKAWKGTWDRPVLIDEKAAHPFTVARMTDHNVKGRDNDPVPKVETAKELLPED